MCGDAKVKGILNRKGLDAIIGGWLQKYRVFAPVREGEGEGARWRFREIHSALELNLGSSNTCHSNTLRPLKELFFPQFEEIFRFAGGSGGAPEVPGSDPRNLLIIGARPCDVHSLGILDRIFRGPDYEDTYYASRRERTLIVSLGCTAPGEWCFCSHMGGGPMDPGGCDIFLLNFGEEFYLEAASRRGEELLSKAGSFPGTWRVPAESDEARLRDIEADALRAMAHFPVAVPENIEGYLGLFSSELWARIGETCLGCGICTYLCPTCHCFAFVDEMGKSGSEDPADGIGANQHERLKADNAVPPRDSVRRLRVWDSCLYPGFTLHASGHNPRPTTRERVRQRFMHKFVYFPLNFGAAACVGCGRCVVYCPVNIDIRAVLNAISREIAQHSPERIPNKHVPEQGVGA